MTATTPMQCPRCETWTPARSAVEWECGRCGLSLAVCTVCRSRVSKGRAFQPPICQVCWLREGAARLAQQPFDWGLGPTANSRPRPMSDTTAERPTSGKLSGKGVGRRPALGRLLTMVRHLLRH